MDRRRFLNGDRLCAAEAWLGADLADIAIHTGPAARRLCRDARARGLAVEGQVFLRDGAAAVLRHELAHAVQQRRHRAGLPGRADPEAEARARAKTPGPVRASADPRDPACWEELGHYYTAYAVLIGAGVANDRAKRIAFYTQLADEMTKLDAKHLFVDELGMVESGARYVERGAKDAWDRVANIPSQMNNGFCSMINMQGAGQMWMSCYTGSTYTTSSTPTADYAIMMDVHKGLHALTGEDMLTETKKRTAILMGIDPRAEPLAFGLGLHAYGDSYAHRDTKTGLMFPPGTGHGGESIAAKTGVSGHVHVDAVGPTKKQDYIDYIGGLYDIALARFLPGDRVRQALPRDQVVGPLVMLVSASDDAADTEAEKDRQAGMVRGLARRWLGGPDMHAWAPEKHELQTLEKSGILRMPGAGIDVTAADLTRALAIARHWSQSSGAFLGRNPLPSLPP